MELKQTEAFRSWESKLRDSRARTTIAARLLRLSDGHTGDIKSVGEGVSELRIHYGPGYRVYIKQHGDVLIILLCGGDKSSQAQDIAKAKTLAKTWSS